MKLRIQRIHTSPMNLLCPEGWDQGRWVQKNEWIWIAENTHRPARLDAAQFKMLLNIRILRMLTNWKHVNHLGHSLRIFCATYNA